MTTKEKYWDPIIESYSASGLSQRKFCQEQQVSYIQFRYYLKKSNENNSKAIGHSFEPIIITKKSTIPLSGATMDLTLHLPNTIRVDIKIEQGNALTILLKNLVTLC